MRDLWELADLMALAVHNDPERDLRVLADRIEVRVRATYDLRIRGGDNFFFIFDDGSLTIEGPSSRRVDCHISADPGAFLRVCFARQSQWMAIAKGKPQLRALVRNP